ncbi:hypothetical protein CAPTEDRAFT_217729 [Capitella teleta]|uniref:DUF6729 domain-containing protein n=1 Tax=Capitella teleta TaxID=283909 RepID=X2AMK9_CAPTE|nr:hypothetical protein CAPTEDRAFT_217729 [Capitella teleta]|eukprot:ELU00340.1 hypothetical protein CAPTEDRAFT_217729 [Capitella teleta]
MAQTDYWKLITRFPGSRHRPPELPAEESGVGHRREQTYGGMELAPPEFHLPDRWTDLLSRDDQKWLSKEILDSRLSLKRGRSLWFHPDDPRPNPPGLPHASFFFRPAVSLWFPQKMWGKIFHCPQGHVLNAGGFNKSLREVLDVDFFYIMATETLLSAVERSYLPAVLTKSHQEALEQDSPVVHKDIAEDDTFESERGTDVLGVPLFPKGCLMRVWGKQQRHLPCIQDPPGVTLYYKETHLVRKGGVPLPAYKCSRGSTSLEGFRNHLARFIPAHTERGAAGSASPGQGPQQRNQEKLQMQGVLAAGLQAPLPPLTATDPLPAAQMKFYVKAAPPPPPPPQSRVAPSAAAGAPHQSIAIQPQPSGLLTAPSPRLPYATRYARKRRLNQPKESPAQRTYCRTQEFDCCKHCGQPSQGQTGHRRAFRWVYCPSSEVLPFKQWKTKLEEEMGRK